MKRTPSVPAIFQRRRAGVLLHLTSLPGPHGVGDLGPQAMAFADWCERAGLSLWQMLPIGPVGGGDSPYSATSSFAAEPLLVSLDGLVREGLLPRSRLRAPAALGRGPADFAAARRFKFPRFQEAFAAFARRGGPRSAAFRSFERSSRDWLPGWCRFAAAQHGGPLAMHAFVQFQFHKQWMAMRAHCRRRGVLLVGDLPIFVTLDSADVADRSELFRLERDGRPRVGTGVPPDCFSRDGQLWGHPHYAWAAHRREGFRWWTRRVATALDRFDALRIDHFVGFVHAYEIPGAARTARKGRWAPTPGRQLLTAVSARLGRLPLIAEDLGAVTPAVVSLRDDFGLPGMKLLHNAFYGPDSGDLPHHHPVNCVVYPGTHDNDVSRGWVRHLDRQARERFVRLAGGDLRRPEQALIRMAYSSPSRTAVVAMQDLLGLGPKARMNVPGVAHGNWTWRLDPSPLPLRLAAQLNALARDSGRLAN
ncbi:MAG: 4-alpha-glucanotransferase [Phycisphaerales bacterium]